MTSWVGKSSCKLMRDLQLFFFREITLVRNVFFIKEKIQKIYCFLLKLVRSAFIWFQKLLMSIISSIGCPCVLLN